MFASSTNPKPKCVQCEVDESLLWRPLDNGHICYNCFEDNTNRKKSEQQEPSEATVDGGPSTNTPGAAAVMAGEENKHQQRVRKSTRSTRYKAKSVVGVVGGAHASGANGSAGTTNAASATAANGSGGGAPAGNGNGSKAAPKGRSRRNLFKKIPTKTPTATATTTCVESLFFNVSRNVDLIVVLA